MEVCLRFYNFVKPNYIRMMKMLHGGYFPGKKTLCFPIQLCFVVNFNCHLIYKDNNETKIYLAAEQFKTARKLTDKCLKLIEGRA